VGFIQWNGWESIVVALPAVVQRIQRQVSEGALQQEGSNSFGWVPLVLDPKAKILRCSMPGGNAAAGP